MKTTLLEILWKKELIHWRRVKDMFKKFKGWLSKCTVGLIIAFLITLFHYIFAVMHTLYELTLYVFARKTFKNNLEKLALTI